MLSSVNQAIIRIRRRLAMRFRLSRRRFVVLLASIFIVASVACSSSPEPVVFQSNRDGNLEIYAVEPDGSNERNLTKSSLGEFSPLVSPNRQWVAFLTASGPNVSLEIIGTSGEDRQQLTTGPGVHSAHRWAPNSNRIAYVAEISGDPSLNIVEIGEKETMLLTAISGDEIGDWSPDGKSVVFSVLEGPEQGIYIRNPDGVNEFRVTDTPDYSPKWSADGDMIAFLSVRDGNPEIYVMNADGSQLRRLTDTGTAESEVSWSPSGKRLLYVSEEGGNKEIHVADLEAGTTTRLTHNDVRDDQPVWSPSGKQIAFVSYLDGDAEIFIMDAGGGDQTRLTNNGFEDTDPSW